MMGTGEYPSRKGSAKENFRRRTIPNYPRAKSGPKNPRPPQWRNLELSLAVTGRKSPRQASHVSLLPNLCPLYWPSASPREPGPVSQSPTLLDSWSLGPGHQHLEHSHHQNHLHTCSWLISCSMLGRTVQTECCLLSAFQQKLGFTSRRPAPDTPSLPLGYRCHPALPVRTTFIPSSSWAHRPVSPAV